MKEYRMKDYEIILKMIEEVSPDDTAKLDEIDARTDAYVSQRPYNGMVEKQTYATIDKEEECWWIPPQYTHSRDALKVIRPKGWIVGTIMQGEDGWSCHLYLNENAHSVLYGLPTEELAELHAIIQAIAYERENK